MKKRPGYSIRAALIIGVFAYAYYRTDNLYASGAAAGLILALKPFAKGIRRIRKKQKYKNSSLAVIDKMEGHEFEEYLETQFKSLGYKVKNVGSGGRDYGVDLIISKKAKRLRYRQNGITAVSE